MSKILMDEYIFNYYANKEITISLLLHSTSHYKIVSLSKKLSLYSLYSIKCKLKFLKKIVDKA